MTTIPATATDLALASSGADAAAVVAVEQHHAELAGRLRTHVAAMLESATAGDDPFSAARRGAVSFAKGELAPHAAAEEQGLYPAAGAQDRGRLLIDGMMAEHEAIGRLVDELATTSDPLRAAAAGYALQVLFEVHLAKENELVLPLLAADPSTSLAGLLEGMHELLGGHADSAPEGSADGPHGQAHGACGCGGRTPGACC